MSIRTRTPGLLAEWSRYVLKNRAARAAYYDETEHTTCLTGKCDDGHLCWRCREKAAADLLVATSVDECAELLALLDLPGPGRGARATEPCGTPAAYKRHLRHGEKACAACIRGNRAKGKTDRQRARNRDAVRRYRAAKKNGAGA